MDKEIIAAYNKLNEGLRVFPPWATCAEIGIMGVMEEDNTDIETPNIVYKIKK